MRKYLLTVILAVAPAAVSAQVLNTIEENLSAANAAIENGDLAGGHRLASEVMDGVNIEGGNTNAVYTESKNSNSGSKLVSVTKAAKTGKSFQVPTIGKENGSNKKGPGSFLKNEDASVAELGLAMILVPIVIALAAIVALIVANLGAALFGGAAAALGAGPAIAGIAAKIGAVIMGGGAVLFELATALGGR